MAGGLGSLVVKLGLDAAEFTSGLTKAEAQAYKSAKAMQQSIENIGKALAVVGVAAVGAAFGLSKIIEGNAKFQDLAETIGDTAVNISSLREAVAQSGASFDSIGDFSIRLTKALSSQDEESKKAGAGIKALGLDFEEFKKQTPVEQLKTLALTLQDFEDGAGKTAVLEALAKGGAKLLPFLNDLADKTKEVSSLTAEQIANSNEYAEALGVLKGRISATASTMGADLAPRMTRFIESLQDTLKYLNEGSGAVSLFGLALDGLKVIFQTAIILAANVGFVFKSVATEIGGIAVQLGLLATGDLKGFNLLSKAMKEDADRARKELEDFEKKILAPTPKEAEQKVEKKRLDISGLAPKEKKEAVVKESDYANLNKRILETIALQNEELNLGRELSKEESFVAKLKADAALSKVALSEKELKSLNANIEVYQKQAESVKGIREELEKTKKEQKEQDDLVKSLTASALKANNGMIENLRNLEFENSLIGKSNEEKRLANYLRDVEKAGIAASSEKYEEYRFALADAIAEGKRFSDITASVKDLDVASREVFGNLLSGAEKPFDALRKLIQRDLIDQLYALTVKKWVIDIGTNISGSSASGVGGSIFSSLLGGLFGKADGGAIQAGGIYPFLERGTPEVVTSGGKSFLFAGKNGGYVNNRVASAESGGGGVMLNQNVTIDARGADAGVEARLTNAIRQMGRDTIAKVQDMNRRSPAFLGR